MNLKKSAWMAGLLVATLAIAAVPGFSDTLSFQDDDVEAILRCSNVAAQTGCAPITAGTLSVGDIFYSVFEIPTYTIGGVNGIPAGQELTGIAAVRLESIVGATYTFGTFTGLNAFLTTSGYTGAALPAGTAVAMFLNGTAGPTDINLILDRSVNPATNCTTVAMCTVQATTGSLLQLDGGLQSTSATGVVTPALDPDNSWIATITGSADIATVLASNNASLVASANFYMSNFFHAGGVTIGRHNKFTGLECVGVTTNVADNCVQFSGSGTITGGQGLSNGFIAHSDFDMQKVSTAAVPEPATLSLLGVGLLALGALRMRRNKA